MYWANTTYGLIIAYVAQSDEDVREIYCSGEELNLMTSTGLRKSVSSLTTGDRTMISKALLDYHLMTNIKAEMDQFRCGLEVLGSLDLMRSNPSLWEPYFIASHQDDLSPGS